MKATPIKTRFIVDRQDHQGKPFFYTTDLAQILELGLPHNDNWHCTNVKKGSILTIEGRKYKVMDMMLVVLDEPAEVDPTIGTNLYGHGGDFEFNFEVRLYVLDA